MRPWTFAALFALVVWSVQRAVSKAVLATPQFYLLSALISLPSYVPVRVADPPPASALPGALGDSALMALASLGLRAWGIPVQDRGHCFGSSAQPCSRGERRICSTRGILLGLAGAVFLVMPA